MHVLERRDDQAAPERGAGGDEQRPHVGGRRLEAVRAEVQFVLREALARGHRPAGVGNADDRRDAWVVAEMQARRHVLALVNREPRMLAVQPAIQPLDVAVARRQLQVGARLQDLDGVHVDERVEVDDASVRHRRHAVIGHGDDRRATVQPEVMHAGDQLAQRRVEARDRRRQFGRVGAEVVAGRVHVVEVERDQRRPLRRRQRQPRQHLRDAVTRGELLVERLPVGRPDAADRCFRSRPEHGGRAQALTARRRPDRFAAPPERVLRRLRRLREALGHRRVAHRVADDAVVFGVEAGDERVVIREGEHREGRDQRPGADAARRQRLEVGRRLAVDVVPAPAVE